MDQRLFCSWGLSCWLLLKVLGLGASSGSSAHSKLTSSRAAAPGKDRHERTLRVGSIPQSVHHCQGWAASTETWERAQRGKNIPKYSTDLNCLIQKNAIQVFNTFLNFLELSGCMKTEKHKLVVKVAWKICNHIKHVNSKKWANLLWMHCKSDTSLLKQYKNLIK